MLRFQLAYRSLIPKLCVIGVSKNDIGRNQDASADCTVSDLKAKRLEEHAQGLSQHVRRMKQLCGAASPWHCGKRNTTYYVVVLSG